VLQIPGVTDVTESFLEPTFEDSQFGDLVPSEGSAYLGLLVGAAMALAGIALAHRMYVAAPGTTDRLRARARAAYTFLVNKWYFDELYDAVVYRPVIGIGAFANSVFERLVVQGIVAGAVGIVRGVGVAVRGAQSGFVRAYALLLVGGFAALGLYFLVVSS
jgi:NADH-quinone oxidoreductase subunit L